MRLVLACSLLFCGLAFGADDATPVAPAENRQRSDSRIRLQTLALEGRALTGEQVAAAEARVQEHPNDLEMRYRLLGYYAGKTNQKVFDARAPHILWLIENRPEDPIFSTAFVQVDQRFEQKTFVAAMELWKQSAAKDPKNTAILGHAARFALRNDRVVALRLLDDAKKIEPQNPEWPRRRAGVHQLQAFFAVGTAGVEVFAQAYGEWKNVYRLTTDEGEKLRLLPQMTSAAWDAGDLEGARDWAHKTLDSVATLKPQNRHGEALHVAHRVLGQLALRDGQVDAAKEHLLASAQIPGSPKLNSFGPNMRLAHDLSIQGQREVVVQYLEACRTFWVVGAARIDEWIGVLKEGDTPDFGNNLKL